MWQNLMAGLIVVLAALYCLWYVLPLALRQKLGRLHPALGPAKPCPSCSSCGGCAAGAKPKAAADQPADQPAEHVIKFHRQGIE